MPSKIEWAEEVWNPVTGCTKISAGCANCYAEKLCNRWKCHPNLKINFKYRNGFGVTMHSEELSRPSRWKKPRRIFVCSMGDLFHKDVPDEFIDRVLQTMDANPLHTFQVLTKRAARMAYITGLPSYPPNSWLGVSIENVENIERLHHLKHTSAPVRFISFEPLLGPIPKIDLSGIDWVIVGGESGPGARPMHPEWARGIRDQCVAQGVPFFFKQWGAWKPRSAGDNLFEKNTSFILRTGHMHVFKDMTPAKRMGFLNAGFCLSRRVGKKAAGRELDGRTWDEMPKEKDKNQ